MTSSILALWKDRYPLLISVQINVFSEQLYETGYDLFLPGASARKTVNVCCCQLGLALIGQGWWSLLLGISLTNTSRSCLCHLVVIVNSICLRCIFYIHYTEQCIITQVQVKVQTSSYDIIIIIIFTLRTDFIFINSEKLHTCWGTSGTSWNLDRYLFGNCQRYLEKLRNFIAELSYRNIAEWMLSWLTHTVIACFQPSWSSNVLQTLTNQNEHPYVTEVLQLKSGKAGRDWSILLQDHCRKHSSF